MTYLKFDKNKLINLEYSLSKEILRSNRAGSYAATTIIGCNTRKYHGLLICPMDQIDGERHVLLSSLDETVIQHGSEFNLGIHRYPGDNYYPKGHKYVRDFEAEYVATTIYRVGGVILKKESLMVEKEEQVLVKYTLLEAHSPTWIRFRPFLAFRNIHTLTKANMDANTRVDMAKNGIKMRLYTGYPFLFMQFNKPAEFVQVPDWYYNIEYAEEQKRGYDFQEDLFVPGYFEVPIKKDEEIIFSASTRETSPLSLKRKWQTDYPKRIPRDSYKNCLLNSAQQFIVKKEKKTEVLAGFPWFGSWGRDTFISLPGITLAADDEKTFRSVIETQISKLKGGLFPNMGSDDEPAFNSVDAPMFFFWSLQQWAEEKNNHEEIWAKFGKPMKAILDSFRQGALPYNIHVEENGLVYAGEPGVALTWMDAVVFGKPVTARSGYAVEINALWYNALMFSMDLARRAKDTYFIRQWKNTSESLKNAFIETFWNAEKGYLADVVNGGHKDFAVRPNMVIAAALKYTPLTDEMIRSILDIARKELLTPKGLRTLSPNDPNYKGVYEGDQVERDSAYHMGTVWPWLLQYFCEAWLKIYKRSGLQLVKDIYHGFEPDMMEHGIGSISEIYDGDPPHYPKGSISQAWSVGALLRINAMIENFEKQMTNNTQ